MIEMTAILPEKMYPEAIINEIVKEMQSEGRLLVRELRKTTATWKTKVKFEFLVELDGNTAYVLAGPVGKGAQLWTWLNEGTKAHRVPKTGVATMSFHPSRANKTKSRWIGSTAGGPRGARVTRRGAWIVGGVKKREWTKVIGQKRARPFQRRMIKAVNRGARNLYKRTQPRIFRGRLT